jgi:hypothetical protein
MKLPLVLLATAVAPALVHAQIVYLTDFSGPVGAEWSHTTTSTTPTGDRPFLGEFGNHAVTLDLVGLPVHSTLTISFDLFLIQSWDGNSFNGPADREFWRLLLGDSVSQSVELNTTFSNVAGRGQAFPSNSDNVTDNPRFTGASEIDTLGYANTPGIEGDSVYSLSFTVAHTANDFRAVFEGYDLQALADESWGLANLQVSVASPVPEPGEYAAVFGVGLAGVAAWRRRSRKQADTVQAA